MLGATLLSPAPSVAVACPIAESASSTAAARSALPRTAFGDGGIGGAGAGADPHRFSNCGSDKSRASVRPPNHTGMPSAVLSPGAATE
jgi:hypothetical protein